MATNTSCAACKKRASDKMCICGDLPLLCSACWEQHTSQEGFHFGLPAAARGHVTAQNQREFTVWLTNLDFSQRKLRANLPALDECYRNIEAAYEGLIQDILSARDRALATLRQFKEAFAAGVERAIQDTSANAYRSDYMPPSELADLIWRHYCFNSPDPLSAFSYEVKNTDERLRDPLEISVFTVSEFSSFAFESGGTRIVRELQDLQAQALESAQIQAKCRVLEAEVERLAQICANLQQEVQQFEAVREANRALEQYIQTLTQENAALKAEVAILHEQTTEGVKREKELTALVVEKDKLLSQASARPVLVHVSPTEIHRFDFNSLSWSPTSLQTPWFKSNPKIDPLYGRWVALEDDSVFYCGGKSAGDSGRERYVEGTRCSYLLSKGGAITELASMLDARFWHGVVAVFLEVYAFGGCNLQAVHKFDSLKTCEKYVFMESAWRPLPEMREPRYDFNPCVWRQFIYVCGLDLSVRTSMEAFDVQAQCFLLLEATCEGTASCLCVHNDLLVVLSRESMRKYRAEGPGQLVLQSQVRLPSKEKCQSSQPAVMNGHVYLTHRRSVDVYSLETGQLLEIS